MSSNTQPISPTTFAEALKDLPVASLYAKVSELQNSIKHLKSSNEQLQPFAAEGDEDCKEAIKENEETMDRMQHRILLIESEIEMNRGMKWEPEAVVPPQPGETSTAASAVPNGNSRAPQNGGLSDDELRRRLEARMNEELGNDDAEDGVFL